jgi:hypothetical protein
MEKNSDQESLQTDIADLTESLKKLNAREAELLVEVAAKEEVID